VHGKKFTVEEVQRLVGGDVQLLEVTPGIYGAIKVTARDKMFVVREGETAQGFPEIRPDIFKKDFASPINNVDEGRIRRILPSLGQRWKRQGGSRPRALPELAAIGSDADKG
jgi:hypothetical protein